jgi:deoxyinosine 3'endonuclease (endonuclease V)
LEDNLPKKIRTVGGVDVSYVGTVGRGAVTVLDRFVGMFGNPGVGAAKSRLKGRPINKHGKTLLVDKPEVIGKVVTTKPGSKPV